MGLAPRERGENVVNPMGCEVPVCLSHFLQARSRRRHGRRRIPAGRDFAGYWRCCELSSRLIF